MTRTLAPWEQVGPTTTSLDVASHFGNRSLFQRFYPILTVLAFVVAPPPMRRFMLRFLVLALGIVFTVDMYIPDPDLRGPAAVDAAARQGDWSFSPLCIVFIVLFVINLLTLPRAYRECGQWGEQRRAQKAVQQQAVAWTAPQPVVMVNQEPPTRPVHRPVSTAPVKAEPIVPGTVRSSGLVVPATTRPRRRRF